MRDLPANILSSLKCLPGEFPALAGTVDPDGYGDIERHYGLMAIAQSSMKYLKGTKPRGPLLLQARGCKAVLAQKVLPPKFQMFLDGKDVFPAAKPA